MSFKNWPHWLKSGLILLFVWLVIFIFLFIISWNGPRYQLKSGLILLLVWLVVFVFLFIKGWDWPRWLKSGLILLSIWLVIFIFFLYDYLTCTGMLCGIAIVFPLFPSDYLISLITESFFPFAFYTKHALSMVIISAFLNGLLIFIVGALIGWIYGKIKNKRVRK